jgi:hypothetical protein
LTGEHLRRCPHRHQSSLRLSTLRLFTWRLAWLQWSPLERHPDGLRELKQGNKSRSFFPLLTHPDFRLMLQALWYMLRFETNKCNTPAF